MIAPSPFDEILSAPLGAAAVSTAIFAGVTTVGEAQSSENMRTQNN